MSFLKKLFGHKETVKESVVTRPTPHQPQGASEAVSTSPDQQEQLIHKVLAKVEARLKAAPNSSLPVVTLSLRDTPLGKNIVWCYRTTYSGPTLNVAQAEAFLNAELEPINVAVHESDYMGGKGGESNQLFEYRTKPRVSGTLEEQVKEFDKLDRKQAVPKAEELLAQGQIDLLVAWLRYGRYHGIPAEVLQKANHLDAARTVLAVLKDPAPEVRMRGAAALGPLGGVDAARDLCAALPGAKTVQECLALARPLGRLAWPGAVEPIFTAMQVTQDPNARAALAGALVRCGDVERGLNALYAGFSDSRFPEAYVGTISDLDKEGMRDSRLVAEMVKLLDHAGTGNNNANQIANDVISRHKSEWEESRTQKYAAPVRQTPTMKVKPFGGTTLYPINDASAITGIPVAEIHRLMSEQRVFARPESVKGRGPDVQLYGKVPCGELVDHSDPRMRGIGARAPAFLFDLDTAIGLLGQANVVTPEQNVATFGQPLPKDEPVRCPSIEQVKACAAQNKAGTNKWFLVFASALSFRDQHRILGTDCNRPPNFDPGIDFDWFFKPPEKQWEENWVETKPEPGYYLLDMTPRWNLANRQQQRTNTTAWGSDYYKATNQLILSADERVFSQALLAHQKTTGHVLFDYVYHWGNIHFGPSNKGSDLRIGLFENGLFLAPLPEATSDSKDSFVCVCWRSGDEALID